MILKEALKIALENKKITDDSELNQIYNICKELGYEGTEEEFMEEFLNLLQNETDQMNNNELDMVSGGKNNLISRIGACSLSALGALSMVSSPVGAITPIKRRLPVAPTVSVPQLVQKAEAKSSTSIGKTWEFIKLHPKLSVAIAAGLPVGGVALSIGGKKLYDNMTYKNAFIDGEMVKWPSSLNKSFEDGFKAFDEKINSLKGQKVVPQKTIDEIRKMVILDSMGEQSGLSYLVGLTCPWLKERLENEVFKKCVRDEHGNLKIDGGKAIKIWNEAKKKMAYDVKFAMEHDEKLFQSLGYTVAAYLNISISGSDRAAIAVLSDNPEICSIPQKLESFGNKISVIRTKKEEILNNCKGIDGSDFINEIEGLKKELNQQMDEVDKLFTGHNQDVKEMNELEKQKDVEAWTQKAIRVIKFIEGKMNELDDINERVENIENRVKNLKSEYEEKVDKAKREEEKKAKKEAHVGWFSDQLDQLVENINSENDANCANLFKIEELKKVLNETGLERIFSLNNVQFKAIHEKFIEAFTLVTGKYLDKRNRNYVNCYNDDIDVSKFLNNYYDNEKKGRKDFLKALLYYEQNVRDVYRLETIDQEQKDVFVYHKINSLGLYVDQSNATFHNKELMYHYKDKEFGSYIDNINKGSGTVPIANRIARKLLLGKVKDDKRPGGKEACKAIGRFISLIARMLPKPFEAEEDTKQAPQEAKSTQPTESAPAQPTEQPSDQISDN